MAASTVSGPTTPGARSRTFSFRSDHSGGSRQKDELTDSPREKARKDQMWKNQSKANPNAALVEAQPGAKAVLEESTLQPLREIQHRDTNGNVIVDPDLSNPTRPRLERPLDTIRSFEKAIDNGYKRRSNYMRSESFGQGQGHGNQQDNSRRNSSYGYDNGPSGNRQSNIGGGYYGNQRQDTQGFGPGNRPRHGPPRTPAEPAMYSNGPRPYPGHGPQYSQDTVYTGGSDSTGPWANSTDPSSENSSVERGPIAPKHNFENSLPPNGYGQNGYGPNGFSGPIPEEGGAYPMSGRAPPVQPPHRGRPIPLGNSGDLPALPGELPSAKRPSQEKRKSWLKRTFSKKDSN